jgi:hypothetical protein
MIVLKRLRTSHGTPEGLQNKAFKVFLKIFIQGISNV